LLGSVYPQFAICIIQLTRRSQAPFVGWSEPYEYIILIVGVAHLAAFVLFEAKFAKHPILPFNIWKAPSFGVLMLVLFFAFMSIGIYIWYCTIFLYNIRGFNPVMVGVGFLPLTVLGTAAAFLAGWLVPRLSAQVILGIGCTAAALSSILLATTPEHQIYWAMIFPSMVIIAFTADLIFAAAQIIASNAVGKEFQGAAGSLIGTLLTYGLSTGLGFAGTVEVYTNHGGKDLLKGYRAASFLAVGFAGAALVLNVLFVRMPKLNREGW
jgi:MFS family permease